MRRTKSNYNEIKADVVGYIYEALKIENSNGPLADSFSCWKKAADLMKQGEFDQVSVTFHGTRNLFSKEAVANKVQQLYGSSPVFAEYGNALATRDHLVLHDVERTLTLLLHLLDDQTYRPVFSMMLLTVAQQLVGTSFEAPVTVDARGARLGSVLFPVRKEVNYTAGIEAETLQEKLFVALTKP